MGFGGRAWIVSNIPEWPFALIADFLSACAGRPWSRLNKNNIRDLPLSGKWQSDLIQLEASGSWCRGRKRNYPMSIKRLFDAVERRGDIGRRVAALVLPISNRPRVTSRCAGKIGLREPGAYERPEFGVPRQCCSYQNLYTILETLPPAGLSDDDPWKIARSARTTMATAAVLGCAST